MSSSDAPVRCECGGTPDLLHDCDHKEREVECPCIMRDPADYDGPMEDCPLHGRDAAEHLRRYEDAMIAAEHEAGSALTVYKARAAMAVADAEQGCGCESHTSNEECVGPAWVAISGLREENARLRAELGENTRVMQVFRCHSGKTCGCGQEWPRMTKEGRT